MTTTDPFTVLRSPSFPLQPDARFGAALKTAIEDGWPGAGRNLWRTRVLAALQEDDATLVDVLDEVAREAMGEAPHQLGALSGQILDRPLDLHGHPWACLLLVVAARSSRPPHPASTDLLALAKAQLDNDPDPDPECQGYLAFVQGQVAFEAGELALAADWYQLCRQRLGSASPLDVAVTAFDALGAYWRGDLVGARALAVEAAVLARGAHNGAVDAFATLIVAFCDLNFGKFDLAAVSLGDSIRAYERLTDAVERMHFPLAHAGFGVLHAVRRDVAKSLESFREGIRVAEENGDGTYRAAVLAVMAEFTAEFDPVGAAQAAQEAQDFLVATKEKWWVTWAQRAQGLISLVRDDHQMAVAQLEPLTKLELSPLEMARTHLYIGEAALRSDATVAKKALLQAIASFEASGSQLLLARALLALSSLKVTGAKAARARALKIILRQTDPAFGRLLPPLEVCMLGTEQILIDHKECRFRTQYAKKLVMAILLEDRSRARRVDLGARWWPKCDGEHQQKNVADTVSFARKRLNLHGWRLSAPDVGIVAFERRWMSVDYLDYSAEATAIMRLTPPISSEIIERAKELRAELAKPLLPAWAKEEWVHDEDTRVRQGRLQRLDEFLAQACR